MVWVISIVSREIGDSIADLLPDYPRGTANAVFRSASALKILPLVNKLERELVQVHVRRLKIKRRVLLNPGSNAVTN